MVTRNDRERALEALHFVPNNLPRTEWLRAGMGAISCGVTVDELVRWSRGASNYVSDADVRANFRNVKADDGVGAGTLFMMARAGGWRDDGAGRDYLNVNERRDPRPLRRAAEAECAAAARTRAAEIWERCGAVPHHAYIAAKGGNGTGLRVVTNDDPLEIAATPVAGWLVVPAFDTEGRLQTLQFVAPPEEAARLRAAGRPAKLNLPGPLAGAYFVVGPPLSASTERTYVVEGIGQAWAIHEATQASAVVCFGAGLFGRAAGDLRERCPRARVVLVPDRGKEDAARRAAAAIDGDVVVMPEAEPTNFDANDLARRDGVGALRALVDNNVAPSATAEPSKRYHLKSSHDLKLSDGLAWRVKGVLPTAGLAQVYGESRAGKSFLVLDMAAAIVEGRPWFGHRVLRGPVVYVGLEGEAGLAQRVRAWERHHGRAIPPELGFFVRQPFDIRKDVDDLAAVVPTGCVIFVDTQNRAAPDADENSSREMGAIISGAKRLQQVTDGIVVLVTHKAKHAEPGKGPRGHSSQLAAMDAVLEVLRGSRGERSWRVEKAKDAEDGATHAFRLEVVPLGEDADGDPITSCVVVHDASATEMPEGATESAPSRLFAVAQSAFNAVREADGLADESEWRRAFRERWVADSEQAKAKAFTRARRELQVRGAVRDVDGRVEVNLPLPPELRRAS